MTEVRPVGELLSLIIGGGWGSEEAETDESVKVAIIRGADFPQIEAGVTGGLPIRYETRARVMKRVLDPGDIVLEISGGTKDRPTGRVAFIRDRLLAQVNEPVIPASFCRLLRPDPQRVVPEYLYNWLRDMYSAGRTWGYQVQSTGIANFQIETFKEREQVRLPELAEQRRIAGVLGAFDDLIDSIRKEHSRLVELAQSVLQRSARHEKTFARVGDVADVLRGLSYKGSGLSDSGIPMVNMGSAENFGWLKRSGWKFYTGDFKPRHLAGARDLILVNTEQTWRQEILGWPLLVPGDVQEALFSHHTYRVAFRPGAEWMKLPLWAHLFTAEARSLIDGAVRGTTVANLPIDAVENLTFIVPGRMDPALKTAEALLELAWAGEREVERLEAARDELLPLLMSGRITVDEAWEAVL